MIWIEYVEFLISLHMLKIEFPAPPIEKLGRKKYICLFFFHVLL